MSTIVVNTLTGAVSEYDFAFQSITPTHAGDALGMYELGGDTDAGQPIVARVQTGKTQWGASVKKFMNMIFFALKGSGRFRAHVDGESESYDYDFEGRASGESRAVPGRGIRENYLSFGFSNPDGQAFSVDNIEVSSSTSNTRRT